MPAVRIENLSFAYPTAGGSCNALNQINLVINQGEFVAIQGPSGSGKSTLLYLMGCLLKVQSGILEILGRDVSRLSNSSLAELRNQTIGFVFQQFHLLPRVSVFDNILLPTSYWFTNPNWEELKERVLRLATQVGIADRLNHLPNQLSGGQQQRVAIARALINNPEIIIADEPTGNLDSINAHQILQLLRDLNRNQAKTVIIVTHDNEVARQCDRIITINDGKVEDGRRSPLAEEVVGSRQDDPLLRERNNGGAFKSLYRLICYLLPITLNNLQRSKVRTLLTMTGVSVGIAALLAMLTLGQFTKKKIIEGYAELGVNTLLFNGWPNWDQKATEVAPLTFFSFHWDRDVLPLKRIFPGILRVSPVVSGWGGQASFGGNIIESQARLKGVNEEALLITNKELLYGRNITKSEVERSSQVCIIGYGIGERLFKNRIPIGEVLRVSQENNSLGCQVIGVLRSFSTTSEWDDPNLQIVIPYTLYQATIGDNWSARIRSLLIQVDPAVDIEGIANGIRSFFEQKYGPSGRFRADSDSLLLSQMKRFLGLFTILLATIGLVTLTVGGIGITNMMLVSVSERFREIGLRKALGAPDRIIRIQFLAETVIICMIAGLFGILLGFLGYELAIFGASKFVSKIQFVWMVDPMAMFISIVAIIGVGILSGLFPALKAERLQVMEALRTE